ncbi:MAG: small conductance mechanosensitive channel [Haloarculaceae archaeon]|jgi:small conductance mechanosensitive channel
MHWLIVLATNASGANVRPEWLPEGIPLWVLEVAGSLLVLVAAWLVSRLLVRLLGRRLARRFERPSLTRTALRGLRVGVFLFAGIVILRINGLNLGNIALSVTVFSAVVGVILAPIVGSVISGVFLLADQPYEIGDMVELTGQGESYRGFVEDITLRYTKIFTLDNTFLVIPNGTIRERDVFNYSAEDTRTRQTLDVLVTYESDVEVARDLIEKCGRQTEGVIEGGPHIRIGAARYPAHPDCLIGTFGDHGVLLRLRYWTEEPYRLQTIRSELQTRIWSVLKDADVEFAYPHSHLYFDETSGQLGVTLDEGNGRPLDRTQRTLDESGEPPDDTRRPD